MDRRRCLGTAVEACWSKRCSYWVPAAGGGGERGVLAIEQYQGMGQRAQLLPTAPASQLTAKTSSILETMEPRLPLSTWSNSYSTASYHAKEPSL